jgi:hypothetical protein
MIGRDERWCPHIQHQTSSGSKSSHFPTKRLVPIVFIFSVSQNHCKWGFFDYLKFTVEQAVLTQKGAPVLLASNFGTCAKSSEVLSKWHKDIIKVDTVEIASRRTQIFSNMTSDLFMSSFMPELWGGAALRFFILEDIMSRYNYTEAIHIEGDNMIYGDFQELVPLLRSSYPGLAATPLMKSLHFITASVLWVGNPLSLHYFNDFLLNLGHKKGGRIVDEMKAVSEEEDGSSSGLTYQSSKVKRSKQHYAPLTTPPKQLEVEPGMSDWDGYIQWMRPHACCVKVCPVSAAC